jgi:hypothetical protein
MQPPKDYDPDYHVKNSDFKGRCGMKSIMQCVFSLETLIMVTIITGSFVIGIEVIRTFLGAQ